MKANISTELETSIYEYIYSRMLIDVLNKKILKVDESSNQYKILENRLNKQYKIHNELRRILHENKVKVDPLQPIDDMFNRVRYYVNINGGYKEGEFRFWNAGIKLELKRRFQQLLEG